MLTFDFVNSYNIPEFVINIFFFVFPPEYIKNSFESLPKKKTSLPLTVSTEYPTNYEFYKNNAHFNSLIVHSTNVIDKVVSIVVEYANKCQCAHSNMLCISCSS